MCLDGHTKSRCLLGIGGRELGWGHHAQLPSPALGRAKNSGSQKCLGINELEAFAMLVEHPVPRSAGSCCPSPSNHCGCGAFFIADLPNLGLLDQFPCRSLILLGIFARMTGWCPSSGNIRPTDRRIGFLQHFLGDFIFCFRMRRALAGWSHRAQLRSRGWSLLA